MRKISMKKAIEVIFGPVTMLKKYQLYSCIGKEWAMFFRDAKGQTWYLDYRTLPVCSGKHVMYRTAESENDHTGGHNTWDFEEKLARKGMYVF